MPSEKFLPGDYRTHRFGHYDNVKGFVDGLARAELSYEVNLEGFRRLQQLDSDQFYEMIDNALPRITMNNVMWAVVAMFDGLRLRRGLEVAAPVGVLVGGQRAPFGLDSTASTLLSDGETSVDRERVGRAAQFLLASAYCGVRNSDSPDWSSHCGGQGSALARAPGLRCVPVATDHPGAAQDLPRDCRAALPCAGQVDAHHPRHDRAVRRVGGSRPGRLSHVCLRPRVPASVPKNVRELEGYDGGLLSVWDACSHLLKLHAQEHKEILPVHSLLRVLGGVVGNLVSDTKRGRFVCTRTATSCRASSASTGVAKWA